MAKIWFIRKETDYGPFFSSKEKAIQYLLDRENEEEDSDADISKILADNDPYTSLVEVTLDKEVFFDG